MYTFHNIFQGLTGCCNWWWFTYIWLCPSLECRLSSGSNSSAAEEKGGQVTYEKSFLLYTSALHVETLSRTSCCHRSLFGCLYNTRNVCCTGTFVCGEDVWAGVQMSARHTASLKVVKNKHTWIWCAHKVCFATNVQKCHLVFVDILDFISYLQLLIHDHFGQWVLHFCNNFANNAH